MYPHDNVRLESYLSNVCQINKINLALKCFTNQPGKLLPASESNWPSSLSLQKCVCSPWTEQSGENDKEDKILVVVIAKQIINEDIIKVVNCKSPEPLRFRLIEPSSTSSEKKIHKSSSWFVVCPWSKDTLTDRFVTHIISMIGYSPVQSTWKGWFVNHHQHHRDLSCLLPVQRHVKQRRGAGKS